MNQPPAFDYETLDDEIRSFVQRKTDETRGLLRRTAQNVIAIGRKRIEEALNWDYDKRNLLLAYEMLFHTNSEPLAPDSGRSADEKLEIYQ